MGSFAVRVKAARETMFARTGQAMRQADLGKAVGLSGAAVSTWETGDSAPATELIPKIAKALGVDPAWLAWGKGQSPFQAAPQSVEDAPGRAMRRPGRYRDASAKGRPEQGKKTG